MIFGDSLITFHGHLGADAERTQWSTRLRVAQTVRWRNPQTNEEGEHTTWHGVEVKPEHMQDWVQDLTKGTLVRVTGEHRMRESKNGKMFSNVIVRGGNSMHGVFLIPKGKKTTDNRSSGYDRGGYSSGRQQVPNRDVGERRQESYSRARGGQNTAPHEDRGSGSHHYPDEDIPF